MNTSRPQTEDHEGPHDQVEGGGRVRAAGGAGRPRRARHVLSRPPAGMYYLLLLLLPTPTTATSVVVVGTTAHCRPPPGAAGAVLRDVRPADVPRLPAAAPPRPQVPVQHRDGGAGTRRTSLPYTRSYTNV